MTATTARFLVNTGQLSTIGMSLVWSALMTITIPPELEARLQENARIRGLSVDAYIEELIREDEDSNRCTEPPLEEDDPELSDIRAAVNEALSQADRGEGTPAHEVFARLRQKHRLAR